METRFHIIIRITSANILSKICPILIVLKDRNIRINIKTDLVFTAPSNYIFHLFHQALSIIDVDAVEFYFISNIESDSVLLDSIEVVNLDTKQYRFFPCKQWINCSVSRNGLVPLTISEEIHDKRNCFEVFKGKDNQFYFRLRAGNRQIIAQSEGYKRKASAINGINAVRRIVPIVKIFDLTVKRS